MKLNERGWGYKSLIIFSVLFIAILLGVSIAITRYTKTLKDNKKKNDETKENNSIDNSVNNYTYSILERDLENAGESYSVYHSTLIDFTDNYLIVNSDVLEQDGFSETIEDPVDGSPCDGYVKIDSDGDVHAFIKCSQYKTPDYDLWVE